MKIKLITALLFVLCLCLNACSSNAIRSETKFYYCSQTDYSSQSRSVDSEVRKVTVEAEAYPELIKAYLKGPESKDLQCPFPDGTDLIYFSLSENLAHIVLSKNFSELSGIDLTLACACLSMTVRDLTGYNTVEISAQDAFLDNHTSITMDANDFSLYDTVSK